MFKRLKYTNITGLCGIYNEIQKNIYLGEEIKKNTCEIQVLQQYNITTSSKSLPYSAHIHTGEIYTIFLLSFRNTLSIFLFPGER